MPNTERKNSADTASKELEEDSQQSHCQSVKEHRRPQQKPSALQSLPCLVMEKELKHGKCGLRKSMDSQTKSEMQYSAGIPEAQVQSRSLGSEDL